MCSHWGHFLAVFGSSDLDSGGHLSDLAIVLQKCRFHRPVLKHGPRSLTYVRVRGWKTHVRNESDSQYVETDHDLRSKRFESEHIG